MSVLKSIVLSVFCFVLGCQFVFSQSHSGELVFKIHPVFNNEVLRLEEKGYVNANGDTLFIDEFKFYFSNLCFTNKSEKLYCENESYHLINADDSATLSFRVKNLPGGIYTKLAFNIGVDSLKNVAGALTGDLDPIKGMYWAWNTGYIAAKLTGHSAVCKTLHQAFEFHIGGYLPPYNSLRKNNVIIDELKIVTGKTSYIELYADVSEWFKTPVNIDVSKINSIVLPNKQSVSMADNYIDMIKFKKTINP